MAADAKELYEETVRLLTPKERLRLAAMILQDFTGSGRLIGFSDTWNEQDIKDLTAFALSHSENPHEQKENNS